MLSLLSPAAHAGAARDVLRLLIRYRELAWQMTKREISDRYAGQVLGVLWTVGHPLTLLGVYAFVFVFVFKQRMGGTYELPLDYTTYLLTGLIPWLTFQESMIKASSVIVGNSSLVKQVVFPIDILPIKTVLASFITQFVSTGILIIYVLVSHGGLLWTYALIPVLFVLQFMAMTGVAYFLSSLGAYFRDVKDFVQVLGTVGVFLLPAFYVPDQIPRMFLGMLYLNPFSYVVWCYQDIFYFGRFEHPWAWLAFTVFSIGSLLLGYRLFRKLKPMFGNVL